MKSRLCLRLELLAVGLALPLLGAAQQSTAAAPPERAPAARSAVPEPNVQRTVVEDDHARIDELRVRGAVRSITVQPKGPIKTPYEVVPADAGRDISAGPSTARGSQGQRVWRVLNF